MSSFRLNFVCDARWIKLTVNEQEAQLSQRVRAMLRVVVVTQNRSKPFEITPLSKL